ncbi:hypothetical protein QYF67_06505 [Pseudomonas donghuensis]|uniref:hypothetical protein n=1 Tax=Pseudomonas donghuensis TaxID=1163398 RepID=UPI001678E488|nr:hypothetical protein [Pseudomonas donghuensis]WKY29647.1 hypothetical protein QYF67_06505 [Pseudomonas donghuensis]
MEKLELDVSVEGGEALLRQLNEAMRSLEHFSELPLQVFRDLIANSLHDVSVGFDGTALAAGNLRAVVRLGRHLELVTAALLALNVYLHR